MAEKMWYEKTWDELNMVKLVNRIKSWSDNYDFGGWEPTEEEKETYRLMFEKAKQNDPNNYKLMGCILPEFFGKSGQVS
jgi:hypothetical protein